MPSIINILKKNILNEKLFISHLLCFILFSYQYLVYLVYVCVLFLITLKLEYRYNKTNQLKNQETNNIKKLIYKLILVSIYFLPLIIAKFNPNVCFGILLFHLILIFSFGKTISSKNNNDLRKHFSVKFNLIFSKTLFIFSILASFFGVVSLFVYTISLFQLILLYGILGILIYFVLIYFYDNYFLKLSLKKSTIINRKALVLTLTIFAFFIVFLFLFINIGFTNQKNIIKSYGDFLISSTKYIDKNYNNINQFDVELYIKKVNEVTNFENKILSNSQIIMNDEYINVLFIKKEKINSLYQILKQEFIVPNNVSVNQLITNYVNKTNIELKNVLKNESEFYRSYNVSLDISKQETCNPKILMDCFNKRNVLKYGLSNYFMNRIIYSIKVNQIIFSLTEYKQK